MEINAEKTQADDEQWERVFNQVGGQELKVVWQFEYLGSFMGTDSANKDSEVLQKYNLASGKATRNLKTWSQEGILHQIGTHSYIFSTNVQ